MKLIKYLGIFIVGTCLDAFIFPIGLGHGGVVNSKMLLALLGLIYLIRDMVNQNSDFFNRKFAILSMLAMLVSVAGVIATTVNNTSDYTYSTYIISMWVWVFAAYAVVVMMKYVHGYFSLILLASYIAAIGIFQAFFALSYEYVPAFTKFIDVANYGFTIVYETKGRMQGFSAALDPAGIRFAAMLVIIGYATVNGYMEKITVFQTLYFLFSFILVTIVGNMIARTTMVGTSLVLAYWCVIGIKACFSYNKGTGDRQIIRVWKMFVPMLLIALSYSIVKYNTDDQFKENIRFGFEGFFSLVEKGKWEVSSNEILKNMVVFPSSSKTWLIGDGYIENPSMGGDPYYVGKHYRGYYMGTDIGYLRFIFYFGLVGLCFYVVYFISATKIATSYFPLARTLFLLLLLLNFIIWLKVSTDIFQFFALFIAAGKNRSTLIKKEDVSEEQPAVKRFLC